MAPQLRERKRKASPETRRSKRTKCLYGTLESMCKQVNVRENLPLNFGEEFWSNRETLASILMEAVNKNNKQIVKFVAQSGLKLASYTNEDDCLLVKPTPIHLAFKNKNFDILQILFDDCEHRLNLMWLREKTTIFQIACAVGRLDFIKKFIDNKVDVNEKVRSKNNLVTPLITAVEYAQYEAVALLLKNGAITNFDFSLANGSVLHYVPMSHSDSPKLVELLCEYNAGIEKTDKRGRSMLQKAVSALNLPMVKALLSCGAKPESVKNLEGIQVSKSLIKLHILQQFEDIMDELYKSFPEEKIPDDISRKVIEFNVELNPIPQNANPKEVLQYILQINLILKYFDGGAFQQKISRESYDWLVSVYEPMIHYIVLAKKGLFDFAEPLDCITTIVKQMEVRLGMTDGHSRSIEADVTQKIVKELQVAETIMVAENDSLLDFCKMRSDDDKIYTKFRINVEEWLKSSDSSNFDEQFPCIGGYIKGHLTKVIKRTFSLEYVKYMLLKLEIKFNEIIPYHIMRKIHEYVLNEVQYSDAGNESHTSSAELVSSSAPSAIHVRDRLSSFL